MDFVALFWHCECVSQLSEKAFSSKYLTWCRKHGYKFSKQKAIEIYSDAKKHIGLIPKNNTTKLLAQQAVVQLKAASSALAALMCWKEAFAGLVPVWMMTGLGMTMGVGGIMCAICLGVGCVIFLRPKKVAK